MMSLQLPDSVESTGSTAQATKSKQPRTSAIKSLTQMELKQRVRSGRWRITLGIWFAVLLALTFAQLFFFDSNLSGTAGTYSRPGAANVAGTTLLVVLLVGLVISPAQTATSINGDRRDGVLALVQAAPVSTWSLVLGKLLAAWIAALAFLVTSLPVLLWMAALGGFPWWSLGLAIVVEALLLLAVCGVGLGLSALTPRTGASTMLSYLFVAVIVIGLPFLMLMLTPAMEVSEERTVARQRYHDYEFNDNLENVKIPCTESREVVYTTDARPFVWLLFPNPLVIVSDAMPIQEGMLTPTSLIRDGLSELMSPPDYPPSTCEEFERRYRENSSSTTYEPFQGEAVNRPGWIWIVGLGVNLLFGAGGLFLAYRRLRVPATKLPDNVRIA
ncbi:ABC transporter permease [Corynebacterium sp. H113]|uniref:ABC transporter permease n=1 Tax=Corynebacterium sp. H113 TaxID=3133419 RepID=UPI0030A2464A